MDSDQLKRFLFDNAAIRGEWISLQQSWHEALAQKDYPIVLKRILGEMMAAAGLLSATIKMNGRLVLQIRSQGLVSLAMVECTSDNTLRAMAQWDGEINDDTTLAKMFEQGVLTITIEVDGAKQPYQGMVPIKADSIAECLENYFEQSEQLSTKIWLRTNANKAVGLFLQQLPTEAIDDEEAQENWSRINQLANTITDEELLELDSETLLYRLFNREELRLFEAKSLSFACTCSTERVADTIRMLGQQEAESIIASEGSVDVDCQFCHQHYHFDSVDVAALFTEQPQTENGQDTLH